MTITIKSNNISITFWGTVVRIQDLLSAESLQADSLLSDPPGKTQVYNTILLIIAIMLYIRSPELTYFITESMYTQTYISPLDSHPPVPR